MRFNWKQIAKVGMIVLFLSTLFLSSSGIVFAKETKEWCDKQRIDHPEGSSFAEDIEYDWKCSWLKGSTGGVPTGKLTLPEEHAQKYDTGIVARDPETGEILGLIGLVIRLTNWALGFVGLVAMVAFVFGGYLMVANFGNEEMTNKGKKVIVGSSIGIIVILLSFTAVNALLGAAGGGPAGTVPGDAEGVARDVDVAAISELENTFFEIINGMGQIGDLCSGTESGDSVNAIGCSDDEKYLVDCDGDGVINYFDNDDDGDGVKDENDDDDDGDGVMDASDFCPNTLLVGVAESHTLFDSETDGLYVFKTDADDNDRYVGCAAYEGSWDSDGDGFVNGLVGAPEEKDCEEIDGEVDEEVNDFDCDDDDDDEFDKDDDDNDGDGVVDANSSFKVTPTGLQVVQPDDSNFPGLIAKFEREIFVTCSRLPQTSEVQGVCDELSSLLDDFAVSPNEGLMRGLLEQISILREIVDGIPKVEARITAIPDNEGSAPFVMAFSGSDSRDPAGVSIPEENFEWCLGYTSVEESLNCPFALRKIGSNIYHEFEEVGVYAVQLRVTTADRDALGIKTAMDGYSTITVVVNPPSSNIRMKVGVGDDLTDVTDKRTHEVLYGAALADGITFDASETTDSSGGTSTINFTRWDFGDGEIEEHDDAFVGTRTHTYDLPGVYNVVFEIKDLNFLSSRKILELDITDIVASLIILPESGKGDMTTQFTFDSSDSKVEGGKIDTYFWEVIDETDPDNWLLIDSTEKNRNLNGSVVNYTFPQVGKYKVKVTVATASGDKKRSASGDIQILSRTPIARFMWRVNDKRKPATVFFDASGSTDPDPNTDLKYTWSVNGDEVDLVGNDKVPMMGNYTFDAVGEHRAELVVTDDTGVTDKISHIVKIDSLLDVDFSADHFSTYPEQEIIFTAESDTAAGYFWDFGDGVREYSESLNIAHEYTKSGNYSVTLTVDNLQGEENAISKRVRIGDKDSPIAAIRVLLNGFEIEPDERICGSGDGVLVDRLSALSFDGSNSVNTDGTSRGLKYSWDFDDGQKAASRSTVHKFEEMTVGSDCYEITLMVSDRVTGKTDTSFPIFVRVENVKPIVIALDIIEPTNLVTPVTVPINLIGSKDPDGRVVDYTWYYYDKQAPNKKIDVHVTTDPKTTFTIGPRAKEGIESEYYFVIEMRDNDGGKVNSEDLLGQSQALKVTNGASLAPLVEYMVDKSRAKVGEKITFTSVSKDQLGRYIPTSNYKWDFYGDGRYDREIVGPEAEFTYDRPGIYLPRLKVISEGISETYEMEIIVEAVTEDPEAAFLFIKSGNKIIFINNSTVDPQLDVASLRYAWDFDIEIDTDGNSVTDDDVDSAQVNPTHIYDLETERDVEVKLMVTDEMGQSDEVVRKVISTKKEEFGALGTTVHKKLRAVIDTDPSPDELDKKVYLKQTEGELTFIMKKSTGKIKEYRLDLNIYEDSDDDGIADNDVDNSLHESLDNGAPLTHKYEEDNGRIRAQLTIEDFQGNTDSMFMDIILNESGLSPFESTFDPDSIFLISGMAPIALFTVQEGVVIPQKEATFDASGSSFPEENIKEYRWDFNADGEVDESSDQPLVEYAYESEGQYEITLGIFSESDLYAEYSETIFVRDLYNDPVADFSYELDDLTVRFDSLSTFDESFQGNRLSYEWKFIPLAEEEEESVETEDLEVMEELILTEESSNDAVVVTSKLETYEGLVNRPVTLQIAGLSVEFSSDTNILDASDQPYTKAISVPKVISAPKGSLDLERKVIDAFMVASVKPLFVSQDIRFELDLVSYEGLDDPQIAIFDLADKTWKTLESSEQDNKLVVTHDRLAIYALTDNREAEVVKSTTEAEESFKKTLKISEASTSEDPVKIFDNYGTYKVVLTVTDKAGRRNSKIRLITLEPGVTTTFEPEEILPVEEEILKPVVEEPAAEEVLEEELISEETIAPEVVTTTEVVPTTEEKRGGIGWFMIVMGILIFVAFVVGVIFIFNKIKEQLAHHEDVMAGGVPGMPAAPGAEGETPAPPVEVVEESKEPKKEEEKKPEPPKKETPKEPPAETPKTPEPPKEPPTTSEPPAPEPPTSGGLEGGAPPTETGPAPEGGEGPIPDWLKKK